MYHRKVCNTDYHFKVKRTKGQITIFEFLILQNKAKNVRNLFQRCLCLRLVKISACEMSVSSRQICGSQKQICSSPQAIPGSICLKRTPCMLFSPGLARTASPAWPHTSSVCQFPWGWSHFPMSLAEKSRKKDSEKPAMPPFSLVGRYF